LAAIIDHRRHFKLGTGSFMKVLILADIHGNFDALQMVREPHDELWVLGDLVNYGPEPGAVIEHIRSCASLVVQGNHDHAVAHEDDARWSPRYSSTSTAARRFSHESLTVNQRGYLRALPLRASAERERTRFELVHATPSDPLYGRLSPDADAWIDELESVDADVLLVGHSHMPFIRSIGTKTIVNPGSIGMPRSRDLRSSYVVWEDGRFDLRFFPMPIEGTIAKLRTVGFAADVETDITAILRAETS
jgi:putative phosphoesterase